MREPHCTNVARAVRRYIQAIDDNDSSDWSIIDEFVAEDFVAHNPPLPGVSLDREGLKQAAEIFRVATPGRHEIPLQVAEGDLVVSCIVGRGVHAGELLGIPATNRKVDTDGIAIHRITDGTIVEYWSGHRRGPPVGTRVGDISERWPQRIRLSPDGRARPHWL